MTFPFQIVGFDLDGTLLDTSGDLTAAVNFALAEAGRAPLTVQQVKPMIGGGAKHMLMQTLDATGGCEEDEAKRLYKLMLGFYEAHLTVHTIPFPGAIEAIDALKAKGVRVGIVTNKFESFAVQVLRELGLSDRFDTLIGGDTLGRGNAKPSAAPIHELVSRLGGGRAAFVGDSIYDMQAARNAGVPSIAVSFGFLLHSLEEMGADAVIDGFDELVPALERLGGVSDDALLDAVADPLIVLEGSRVLSANAAARTMFGAHIVDSDIRLTLRQPEAALLLAGSADGSAEFSGPGGADQRLEMRIGAAQDGHRIVQIVDRSARHLADRLRTDFVANASHELRTPLAAIRGFIETLEEDEAGGDPAIRARFLKVMSDEARRMERLIEELLSLSRIEADRFILPDQHVALAELIADVAAETVSQDGGSFAALDVTIDANPHVRGDRAQLSQLLHNLIDNARRYGDPDSPVAVRLWVEQDMAMLSVTDRGPGISAQHLPRLTERFYRVDDARSRASGGTGLGLAIVKHIVDRHRGRLDIRSHAGVGTTVIVELPVLA